MPKQQKSGQKGNPASHRMGNENLKARRAKSWTRGRKRKDEVKKEVAAREKANREAVAQGGATPWQTAKETRAQRRAAAPVRKGGES